MGRVDLEVRSFVLYPTDAIKVSVNVIFVVFLEGIIRPRGFPDSKQHTLAFSEIEPPPGHDGQKRVLI